MKLRPYQQAAVDGTRAAMAALIAAARADRVEAIRGVSYEQMMGAVAPRFRRHRGGARVPPRLGALQIHEVREPGGRSGGASPRYSTSE